MFVQLQRKVNSHFWRGRSYSVTASLFVTVHEREIIAEHDLHKLRLFIDPAAEQYLALAERAHDAAQAKGFFVTRFRDAFSVALNETRAVRAELEADRQFAITLGDLMAGLVVTHEDLSAILEIEDVIRRAVDQMHFALQAAQRFTVAEEDLLVPDGEPQDQLTTPAQWPTMWRRR